MATVTLKIGGKDYQLACEDGQEEQLRFLAQDVDDRVQSLIYSIGGDVNENLALVMTSLTMADELSENKKEIEYLKRIASEAPQGEDTQQLREMEAAMAETLENIASRIERIAGDIEVH